MDFDKLARIKKDAESVGNCQSGKDTKTGEYAITNADFQNIDSEMNTIPFYKKVWFPWIIIVIFFAIGSPIGLLPIFGAIFMFWKFKHNISLFICLLIIVSVILAGIFN